MDLMMDFKVACFATVNLDTLMMTAKQATQIRRKLRHWHQDVERDLPWKEDKNPYKIWLSEIIMQQTRVEQGTPYYLRFVDAFPSVEKLAAADPDALLKLWQGLGYYRRARNMHAAAKQVVANHGGRFPQDYRQLLALPGVGPYTARAIGSFAFDLPLAVVDGNVIRLITRLQAIDTPIEESATQKQMQKVADQLLDQKAPGEHNQAMMDFGSMVCTPRKPNCHACPLLNFCHAEKEGLVSLLPVKKPKKPKRIRHLYYVLIHQDGDVYIRKRPEDEIWPGLHEFYLVEGDEGTQIEKVLEQELPPSMQVISGEVVKKHELTHQTIVCHFYEAQLERGEVIEGYSRVSLQSLPEYAVPRVLDWYLNRKALTLNLQLKITPNDQ